MFTRTILLSTATLLCSMLSSMEQDQTISDILLQPSARSTHIINNHLPSFYRLMLVHASTLLDERTTVAMSLVRKDMPTVLAERRSFFEPYLAPNIIGDKIVTWNNANSACAFTGVEGKMHIFNRLQLNGNNTVDICRIPIDLHSPLYPCGNYYHSGGGYPRDKDLYNAQEIPVALFNANGEACCYYFTTQDRSAAVEYAIDAQGDWSKKNCSIEIDGVEYPFARLQNSVIFLKAFAQSKEVLTYGMTKLLQSNGVLVNGKPLTGVQRERIRGYIAAVPATLLVETRSQLTEEEERGWQSFRSKLTEEAGRNMYDKLTKGSAADTHSNKESLANQPSTKVDESPEDFMRRRVQEKKARLGMEQKIRLPSSQILSDRLCAEGLEAHSPPSFLPWGSPKQK